MKNRGLLATVTILTVLSAVVTIKAFSFATTSAAPKPVTMSARTSASAPTTMAIVPASAIDPSTSLFIGTGDGSNGSWVRP